MKASTFLILTGFLLMLGGVGGVEHSTTDLVLVEAAAIALLGAAVAWCGIRHAQIKGDWNE